MPWWARGRVTAPPAHAASWSGGGYNLASGDFSFVGGGGRDGTSGAAAGSDAKDNIASGKWSTVGGGTGNRASAQAATVAGGYRNTASGYGSSVGGGYLNTASGEYSMVVGGFQNKASGFKSFAAGCHAYTETSAATPVVHHGSFVWADTATDGSCSGEPVFRSLASQSFNVRARGGVRFITGVNASGGSTTGVTLAAGGGTWSTLSDRNAKTDFTPVDTQAVLAKVAALPMTTWRYKTEVSNAMHMGPVAQDFYAAFVLGDSDKSITTVDADGVALAAIQGLNAKLQAELEARDKVIAQMQADLRALKAQAK